MHDYQKAADKLAEIVENEATYGYGLLENYADNWKVSHRKWNGDGFNH